ncbi:MarR family transcriptional regulator [Clostridium sp. C2-6-12]|uniref:MarR family winged helix-turn-helix transcriptional regulator n=1 Tax=Clostridium sp. C2-6-12 TaxID=2698832 RepID=UPI00136BFF04|nr:MarR family transcriptional regulator [Clostridium sp. C2-6-12]
MDKRIHIGKKIIILSAKIRRKLDNETAKYGITGVQGRILGFISHNSEKRDIFQKDIEEELDVRRSSVTSVLQLMEKKGILERVSVSKDARLKKLVLTEKGKEIQRNVHDHILELDKSLRDELSDEEFDQLVSLIDRLSNKIAD